MNVEQLSKLVSVLMDTSLNTKRWNDVAAELADTFDADGCCLQTRDRVSATVEVIGKTAGIDENLVADYETWYHRDDKLAARCLEMAFDKTAPSTELVDEADLVATEFYQHFCVPQGIFHALCAAQDLGNNQFVLLRLYRGKHRTSFDESDKNRLCLLMPHFTSALRLNHQVRTMNHGHEISYSVFDQLSLCTVIVGIGGVIRHKNVTMDRMLRQGIGISSANGKLVLEDSVAQQALLEALETARHTEQGSMVPIRDNSGRPLSLIISPIPKGRERRGPIGAIATIFINNPDERRKATAENIARLYGLTAAESRLARALMDGDRLQDYADSLGISLHTVKTQLKQIFLKTGHTRQSDLVRDIMSNPVLRMRY